MQRGKRDLGGAHQIQLVLSHAVDLLLGVGQEAGPEERPLAHEHGRDHGLEATPAQLLEHPAHERQLEHHQIAFQVGKARARQARSAIHVDQGARQIQMVTWLEGERGDLPHLSDQLVLGARRAPSGRAGSGSGASAA